MVSWNATISPGMARLEQGGWPAGFADTLAELVDEYAKAVVKADKRASKEAANRTGLSSLAGVLATRLRSRLERAAAEGDDTIVESCARAIDAIADAEIRANRNLNLKFVVAGLVSGIAESFGVGEPAGAAR